MIKKEVIMFNNIKYKINGTELRIKDDNKPESTYVILTLRPIYNKEDIMEEIEISVDLENLRRITKDKKVKEMIDSLIKLKNKQYDNWIQISRNMFSRIHKELYHKTISLSF
jgi:single-stranded DNA-specific DHH superfamily exonuclease